MLGGASGFDLALQTLISISLLRDHANLALTLDYGRHAIRAIVAQIQVGGVASVQLLVWVWLRAHMIIHRLQGILEIIETQGFLVSKAALLQEFTALHGKFL